MDEDEVKAVFQTAIDVINKKFSIDSTSFDIVDTQYGWTIKKDNQKLPTMTQLQYKCTVKDKDGRDCTEFFADKVKWEEHVSESGYGYPHRFPNVYL